LKLKGKEKNVLKMYFEVIRKICPYLFPFHFDDNKKKPNTTSLTPPQFIEVPVPNKEGELSFTIEVPVPSKEGELSFTCVLGISTSRLSTIFLLDFGSP
jgi:hypothetical protein